MYPYSSTDMATAWKNSCFVLSEIKFPYGLLPSIVIYALLMCMLTLLSVDEILLLRYMNWSLCDVAKVRWMDCKLPLSNCLSFYPGAKFEVLIYGIMIFACIYWHMNNHVNLFKCFFFFFFFFILFIYFFLSERVSLIAYQMEGEELIR